MIQRQTHRMVIGCMTGTSCDGLDAALVRIRGRGLRMQVELVRAVALPLGRLGPWLRGFAEQRPASAGEIATAMRGFALLHAKAVRRLDAVPDLVVVHGQTVFHQPPVSWQLFQPQALAHAVGAPVMHDLRQDDLARGGQGAPITPLADWITLRHPRRDRAVVNLGGFCNATFLPAGGGPDTVTGRDVCACNQVLDAVARTALRRAYDPGGRHALRGNADGAAVRALVRVLRRQDRGGRSLGTGDEAAAWVARHAALPAADLAASAAAAVGTVIGEACRGHEVLLAGGGARNAALVAAIGAAAGVPAVPSDTAGVPGAWREAMAMAVLGALRQDGIDITLPLVTGRLA